MKASRTLLIVIASWTLLVGGSLVWDVQRERDEINALALTYATTSLDKDIGFRRWGSRHGGVYVPVTPEQPPPPWQSQLPGREITATDGRTFTLISPTTMARQLMDDYAAASGIQGRVTALRYLNPDNAPDPWERTQMEAFARGERKEVWEITEYRGQRHLRFLRGVWMEPGCDKCHAALGFSTGDFRGAAGVNLPMAAYEARINAELRWLNLTYGLIWLVGLAGIVVGNRAFSRKQQALLASEKRFRDLFDSSPDPCWLIRGNEFIDCNRAAVETLGYQDRDEILQHPAQLSPDCQADGQPSFQKAEAMMALARQHGVHRFEWEHRRADGSVFPVEVTLANLELDGDDILYCVWRDISTRKAAESDLIAERDRGKLYLDTVRSLIVALDIEGRVTMINPFGSELLGYASDEIVGRNWFETVLPMGEARTAIVAIFTDAMRGDGQLAEYYENELLTRDGRRVLVAWHNATLRDGDGRVIGTLSAGEDITERRAAEQEVHSLAFYDPLTGLPNRRLLLDRLAQSMHASARSEKHRALLYLDLDRFKILNDTLGHDIGDQLLVEIANRLREAVRKVDTVSRLGGDEFVILIEQLSVDRDEALRQAALIANKIVAAVGEPVDLGVDTHRSTTSIGITLFAGHDESVEELLKHADLAMYQAKAAGRNTVRFYDPGMQETLAVNTAIEKELRQAIVNGEFSLHFQPQIDRSGSCVGTEALLRWSHPERGMVPPDRFVPVAEDSGLIVPIGRWVMHQACLQLREWAGDPLTASLSIAVNVSARQFREQGFIDEVGNLLEYSGIAPELLKIEITESMLVADIEEVIAKITALRKLGIRFALDDFGTGYSSLSYIKRLPLDQLKIDRAFVRDVLVDANDAAICRAIVALGDTLGLQTIAEGVEELAQWEFLAATGCGLAQGYLFARPMPETELRNWLRLRPPPPPPAEVED